MPLRVGRGLALSIPRPLRAPAEVVRALVREWQDDRVSGLAAEVAFFGVLSVFPGLLALGGVLGSLERITGRQFAARAENVVLNTLGHALGESAGPVEEVELLFADARTGVATAALLLALWTASRGLTAVVRALDIVYDLPEGRPWILQRVLGLGLALGTVIVLSVAVAMLVVGPLLGSGRDIADSIGLGQAFATFWDLARWPLMLVILTWWASVVFHVAPNHNTPWRWDLPGAVLTTTLWVAVLLGFRSYLTVSGGNAVLEALGGSLAFILLLYVAAIALLLGGELNAVLIARAGVPQRPTYDVVGRLRRLRAGKEPVA